METITIYNPDGTAILTTATPKGSTLKRELMKEDYITLKLSLASPLSFPLGSYCDTDFGRYTATEVTVPAANESTGGYDYELRLNADYYKWQNKLFKYRPKTGGQEASWSLTAQISVFLQAFLTNLEALGYDKTADGSKYTVTIDNSITGEAKALSFSNASLIDSLTAIAEEFDCDWWVDGSVIHMGKCETGEAVTIEAGVDTPSFDASDSSGSYATRLYVFGGTTNVPLRYRKKLVFDALSSWNAGDNRTAVADTTRPLALGMFSQLKTETYKTAVFSDQGFKGSVTYGQTYGGSTETVSLTASGSCGVWETSFLPVGQFATSMADTYLRVAISPRKMGMDAPKVKFTVRTLLQATTAGSTVTLAESSHAEVADAELSVLLLPLPEIDLYHKTATENTVKLTVSLTVADVDFTDKGADGWNCSSFDFTATLVTQGSTATEAPGSLAWIRSYAETEVTFQSGTYAGQTYTARVETNNGEAILPGTLTIQSGMKYTISPIVSAKVPIGYFISDTDEETTVTAITEQRLMLPLSWNSGCNWIDAEEGLTQEQIVESVVTIDDIYPTLEQTVDSVQTYRKEVTDDDGNGTGQYETFYLVGDSTLTFSDNYRLKDTDLTVLFYSGKLAGMRFTADFHKNGDTISGVILDDGTKGALTVTAATGAFELQASEDYGRKLPDTVLYPATGDTFSLGGYDASYFSELGLVEAAEARLLEKGKEYMEKCKRDDKTYTAKLFWWKAKELQLGIGQKVLLKDPSLFPTDGRESRVTGCELSLDIPHDNPQYTFGESSAYSRLGALESALDSLAFQGTTYIGGTSNKGNAVDILATDDSTAPTDKNVNSARRSESRFLRKDRADTASGLITFAAGLAAKAAARLEQGMTVGEGGVYGMDSGGKVKAADVEAVTGKIVTAMVDYLQSSDYDTTQQTGFGFYRKSGGRYGLNVTDLMVWGKAIFNSLEIRKLYSVGGNIVLSPSASKIFKVAPYYETASDGTQTQTGWKCWLLADDGTTATTNQWQTDDQARCQTFDIAEGAYEGVANKNYWRRVTAVSTENEQIIDPDSGTALYDGQKYAWVVLSKDDCLAGSDEPQPQDTIVCMGNRNSTGDKADRANLIMLETVGEDAPMIALYRRVFGYSLEQTCVFRLSYNGVDVVSKYFNWVSASGDREWHAVYLGEWDSSRTYYYYEEVTHRGTRWLCIAPADGEGTQSEPSETSGLWMATTAIQREKLLLELSGQDTLDWGESITVNAAVYLGDEAVDTSTGWEWSVVRDSGDAVEDAAWNAGTKAQQFRGMITLSFSESCNDLGEERQGVYGTVFTFKAWQTGSKAEAVSATLSI